MGDSITDFIDSLYGESTFSFTFMNIPFCGDICDMWYYPRHEKGQKKLVIQLSTLRMLILYGTNERCRPRFRYVLILNGSHIETRGRELIISLNTRIQENGHMIGPIVSIRKLDDTIYTT